MGFFKEFKEFAMKGNIVDLAVAVIIGGAFGKIVTALTDTIIMPIISLVVGKGGVSDIKFTVGQTTFPIGGFLQAIIDFILIALVLFIIIRSMNSVMKKTPPAPAEPSSTDKLLMEIRDELKK
ncbi:MAG: large conductance mechanosensitive channel protein MscL [Terrimonas sp.]|uniref:large conductance mechanosensitive channel protein MscL n=1 Tax=Terrimonas sp. TaxID=1914338 RepID=UPI000927FCE7|nr:large conductance mechanosensitive channel protein MscL [Terrimonas sp.]MBN8790277.1 large conductance mechanosensitive channel protein MscL [Terrimonas sp.]OJY99018.1 MAG: mechanosensitive ion channel protein MscL [Sphingobacteriales bacterium 40-81]PVD53437.1 large conductance mechanosensitive channel protein MscL [Terrimonas sp.]